MSQLEQALNKLAELSQDPLVKEQVEALRARDTDRVKQIKNDATTSEADQAAQLSAVSELLALYTLETMKNETARRSLTESARNAVTSSVNKVAFIAQRTRNPTLKSWCEQMNVVFAEMSGTVYMPRTPSPIPGSPRAAPKERVPTAGSTQKEHKKWTVKGYYKQTDEVVISPEDFDLHGSVNIVDCEETVFRIKPHGGKLTAVAVDGCRKVGVIIEADVIASVDFVNSKRCQVQLAKRFHLPVANIEMCEGVTVYLSVACTDTAVITSRSSEVNLVHPAGGWPTKPTRTVKRAMKRRDSAAAGDDTAPEEQDESMDKWDHKDDESSSSEEDDQQDVEEEEMFEEVEQVDFDENCETVEVAVPAQFRSYFDASGRLVTEPVQHTGGN